MKMSSKLLITSLLAFITILSTSIPSFALTNKPGDIIITRSTSSKGVTGHVGIFVSSNTILHTSGRANEPYPKYIDKSKWYLRYSQNKIIRPNSSTLGANAAKKAKYYFGGKKIPYRVPSKLTDLSSTYCSELVWYSYYKAGKAYKVQYTNRGPSGYFQKYWTVPALIEPYSYTNPTFVSYNGFKFVDNSW